MFYATQIKLLSENIILEMLLYPQDEVSCFPWLA